MMSDEAESDSLDLEAGTCQAWELHIHRSPSILDKAHAVIAKYPMASGT